MHFSGFDDSDFELFSIGDFGGRMSAIRTRLKPHLIALAEDLAGKIEETVGGPMFPHVAQHMRRRVNPPQETWAAFGRDQRGYKRWTHYRIAVSGEGVRVTVFVEDDADDKSQLGANLAASGERILRLLGEAPVQWYTLGPDGALPQSEVTPQALREAGERLQRAKTAKFQAGVPLPRGRAARMKPGEFERWALDQIELLKPLYLAGSLPSYRP